MSARVAASDAPVGRYTVARVVRTREKGLGSLGKAVLLAYQRFYAEIRKRPDFALATAQVFILLGHREDAPHEQITRHINAVLISELRRQ